MVIRIAFGELRAVCVPGCFSRSGNTRSQGRSSAGRRYRIVGEGDGERGKDPGRKQRKWGCTERGGFGVRVGRRKVKSAAERLDSQNLEVEVLMLMVELGVGAGTALATAASQLFNIMITPLASGGGGGPIGSPSLGPFLSTETAGTANSCPPGGSRAGAGIDERGGGGGGGCRKPSTAASQLLWFWSSIIAS